MECSDPGAIRDEELVAFLEGERVRPAVAEHLAHCQYCSSQLAAYQRLERELTQKLYRWDCPPGQVLGDYQLGMLDAKEEAAVAEHMCFCVLCVAEVSALVAFLQNDPVLAGSGPVPQESGSTQASSRTHRQPAEAKRSLEELRDHVLAEGRRIVAMLLPPVPALAFQRTPGQQHISWPRNYVAEEMTVSLQLERNNRRRGVLQLIGLVKIEGQSIAALQGVPVQLSAIEGIVETQNIDDLGNFVFSSLAPATYTLEVQLPEKVIVIEHISVQFQG